MTTRISHRQRAMAAGIGAADAEYRASRARGLRAAIDRMARPNYQAECEARASRQMSPFVRRALAGELPGKAVAS